MRNLMPHGRELEHTRPKNARASKQDSIESEVTISLGRLRQADCRSNASRHIWKPEADGHHGRGEQVGLDHAGRGNRACGRQCLLQPEETHGRTARQHGEPRATDAREGGRVPVCGANLTPTKTRCRRCRAGDAVLPANAVSSIRLRHAESLSCPMPALKPDCSCDREFRESFRWNGNDQHECGADPIRRNASCKSRIGCLAISPFLACRIHSVRSAF